MKTVVVRRSPLRSAFTLVELLVVIAIIGVLVSLLLPAVQAAREAARRLSCANNLSNLIVAVHNYEMAFEVFPAGTVEAKGPILNAAQGYHHNWIVRILPYIEEHATFRHVAFDVGVYDAKNAPVSAIEIALLRCPSSWFDGPFSQYSGVHDHREVPIDVTNTGTFILNRFLPATEITDGLSHTTFLGESIPDPVLGWMSGTRATLRNMGNPLTARGMGGTPTALLPDPEEGAAGAALPVGGFGSNHSGTVNFAMGDGRINTLSVNISQSVLEQYAQRADGQLITERP